MILAHRNETVAPSRLAKSRMLSRRGEPLFLANWERVLMLHFEVDAEALQRDVPYELDLHDGRAFVSLVAFTMRGMRPCFGGKISAWLFRPIATHDFLNVRTYVRHRGETGIHFLAEWLSNPLAVRLGPRAFSLPYRFGIIRYQNDWRPGGLHGSVTCPRTGNGFAYSATFSKDAEFTVCERTSLDEWLMERYSAFNSVAGRKCFFRVWHPPWPQCAADVEVKDLSLLEINWSWFARAQFIGANYSPGIRDVWLCRPHRIGRAAIPPATCP